MTRTDEQKTRDELIEELGNARKMLSWMRNYGNQVNTTTGLFRAGEQLLRIFIEDMPAAIALFDRDLRYLASSRRWRQQFGLEDQELLRRSYYELFPHTGPEWKEAHTCCLEGKTMRGEEAPFLHPDGKMDWFKWEIRPWMDERKKIGGIIVMMEPVSEQRNLRAEIERSRNELRSAHAYLESVVEAASEVGIIVTNEKGIIRLFNSGAQKMLGYEEVEVEGQYRPSDFREARELQEHSEELVRRFPGSPLEARIRKLETEGVEKGEWTLIRKDGSSLIATVTISPLKDQYGEIIGSVGIFLDVTGEKAAERELHKINTHLEQMVADRTHDLRHANEEIKNFAYIVSHDLRVPLVNIKGFSGELEQAIHEINLMCEEHSDKLSPDVRHQMKFLLQEDIPESLHFINSSAGKMDTMINGVLQLSRMGRQKLDFCEINTSELVREILTNSKHLIEEKQVDIQVRELPDVIADRTALEQVFSNLINNALIYLKPDEHGRIEIGSQEDEVDAIFFVRDNGRGIEEKDISRIFNIFSRAGKNDIRGEGMGLSYVRTLVRRHGGEIACLSEPGLGSTFSFTIPIRQYTEVQEEINNTTGM